MLSAYLLIENDSGVVKVTNLGQFNQDSEAIIEAKDKLEIWLGDSMRIVKIDRGSMIDIDTGEVFDEVDQTLVIHSR